MMKENGRVSYLRPRALPVSTGGSRKYHRPASSFREVLGGGEEFQIYGDLRAAGNWKTWTWHRRAARESFPLSGFYVSFFSMSSLYYFFFCINIYSAAPARYLHAVQREHSLKTFRVECAQNCWRLPHIEIMTLLLPLFIGFFHIDIQNSYKCVPCHFNHRRDPSSVFTLNYPLPPTHRRALCPHIRSFE